jgi:hypothetical protein
MAELKDLFVPDNSLTMSTPGMAAQFTSTKGIWHGAFFMQPSATNSLPVPLDP